MGNSKLNFRNPLELERYLYKTMKMLQEGKLSGNEARAASQIANSWLKCHEMRKVTEFEQRLKYLETANGIAVKKVSK